MCKIKTMLVAVVLATGGCAFANPIVYWHSGEVKKGEHVVVAGGNWNKSAIVDVGGTRVTPEKVTEDAIFFKYPSTGVEYCKIICDKKESNVFAVNAPEIWFASGDEFEYSTPGGVLRIFGRHLAGEKISLGPYTLEATSDPNRIEAKIPSNIAHGDYQLKVGGTLFPKKWTIAPPRKIWKNRKFNIADYGAVPNHGDDCTLALKSAIDAASKNGGGIVYVPCGRFQVTGTIDIPPHVLLRGESMEKSCIYWKDTLTPPFAFIRGTHSFGIHELMIHTGKFRNGIVVTNSVCPSGDAPNFGTANVCPSHDISLKRVHMRFIVDQHQGARSVAERSLGELIHGRAITAYGVERFTMEDCSIYALKQDYVFTWGYGSKHVIRGKGVRIARCLFDQCTWGTFSGRRLEIENCTFRGSNVGISPDTKGLYYGHNRNEGRWENDREALTHDQICNAFNEQVKAKVDGVEAELFAYGMSVEEAVKKGKMKYLGKKEDWVGRELIISNGKGVGQKRRVVAMSDRGRLTLNRPFDIAPDETSRFTLGALRDYIIYADNSIEDAAVALQLYGATYRGVLARNTSTRAGGFLATGGFYSTTPVWFVDMNDNLIDSGMSYWYPSTTSVIPHCSRIGTDSLYTTSSLRTALTRWMSIKRNKIESNGMIDVLSMDTLVEGNTIEDSEYGVISKGASDRQVVTNNKFKRVKCEYADFSKGVPERKKTEAKNVPQKKNFDVWVRDYSYAFSDSYGNPPLTRDWCKTKLPYGKIVSNGWPHIKAEELEEWNKSQSIVLETFLKVKSPVTLSFSRWDEGAELYLDKTLIISGDGRSNSRTIPRTLKPGVYRLRLFRSKEAAHRPSPVPKFLSIQIYNYNVPEDAYTISATR